MGHYKPLCQVCLPECQNQMYSLGMANATTGEMGRHPNGTPAQQCNIKYPDQAIKETITQMHQHLRGVQEFIKKKE